MTIYSTVKEFKRNLPEILDRISFLKKERIPLCQDIIDRIVDMCIYDALHNTSIVDEDTYNKARTELFRARLELNYLTKTLKSLPNYKQYIL